MNTILVQMADTKWTTAAMKAACELARAQKSEVVLVKMLAASFLDWQGMEAREYSFSESECDDLYAYEAIARSSGVPLRSASFKYTDLATGLATAADELSADIVIAALPHGSIPFTGSRELKHLDHLLEARQHHLYQVEQPAACCADWQPHAEALHYS